MHKSITMLNCSTQSFPNRSISRLLPFPRPCCFPRSRSHSLRSSLPPRGAEVTTHTRHTRAHTRVTHEKSCGGQSTHECAGRAQSAREDASTGGVQHHISMSTYIRRVARTHISMPPCLHRHSPPLHPPHHPPLVPSLPYYPRVNFLRVIIHIYLVGIKDRYHIHLYRLHRIEARRFLRQP